mmetsp:Transcript_56553/g.83033  ORF Transcript_56553/g.83033 Transcript_56553/m.83033 type:complete len:205 (-) Transcript_56553:841-1455(-)
MTTPIASWRDSTFRSSRQTGRQEKSCRCSTALSNLASAIGSKSRALLAPRTKLSASTITMATTSIPSTARAQCPMSRARSVRINFCQVVSPKTTQTVSRRQWLAQARSGESSPNLNGSSTQWTPSTSCVRASATTKASQQAPILWAICPRVAILILSGTMMPSSSFATLCLTKRKTVSSIERSRSRFSKSTTGNSRNDRGAKSF